MNSIAWIVILVLVVPMVGILLWLVLNESLIQVPSGSLGLLLVKGRATDRTLLPGAHFVPALRRRMVEKYPSVELAFRAGAPPESAPPTDQGDAAATVLERTGPPLTVTLGDRLTVVIHLTVRFALLPDRLREIHERFGPNGFFGIVRDETGGAVNRALGDPSIGVDSMFGQAREDCRLLLTHEVTEALAADGIGVTAVLIEAIELGTISEVIQATVRTRYELEREHAEAAIRSVRAHNDADLQLQLTTSSDTAWRYRESDLWRDLLQRTEALQVALRAGPTGMAAEPPVPGGSGIAT